MKIARKVRARIILSFAALRRISPRRIEKATDLRGKRRILAPGGRIGGVSGRSAKAHCRMAQEWKADRHPAHRACATSRRAVGLAPALCQLAPIYEIPGLHQQIGATSR